MLASPGSQSVAPPTESQSICFWELERRLTKGEVSEHYSSRMLVITIGYFLVVSFLHKVVHSRKEHQDILCSGGRFGAGHEGSMELRCQANVQVLTAQEMHHS